MKNVKKIRDFFDFRVKNWEQLINYPDQALKKAHGRKGKAALKVLGKLLGLDQVDVNYNPSGMIDGGYVTLIGMKGESGIYISLSCSSISITGDVLYRTVKHMKDYTGGSNNFMTSKDFVQNTEGCIEKLAFLLNRGANNVLSTPACKETTTNKIKGGTQMKFSMNSKDLRDWLGIANKAVSKRNPLPVLQGIYIKADKENGSITLKGADLEKMITCSIPAEIEESGETVLPAKQFIDLIKSINGLVTVTEKKEQAEISWGKKSFAIIKTMNPGEFPNAKNSTTETQTVKIKNSALKDAVQQVVYATGTDDNRPVFTGVLFEFDKECITLVATDATRLSLKKISVENGIEGKAIVPAKAVRDLLYIFNNDEEVEVTLSENMITFEAGKVALTTRLVEGVYPNYGQVIPQDFTLAVKVDANILMGIIERCKLINNDRIILDVNENILTIEADEEIGSIKENMEIQKKGENINVHYNPTYLYEAINALTNTEKIIIFFTTATGPAIVRSANSSDCLALILPLWKEETAQMPKDKPVESSEPAEPVEDEDIALQQKSA